MRKGGVEKRRKNVEKDSRQSRNESRLKKPRVFVPLNVNC